MFTGFYWFDDIGVVIVRELDIVIIGIVACLLWK